MRCSVVGHVEWVDFVRVGRVPEPGEIITAVEHWSQAGGGGAVAAGGFLRLGAETTFFTVVGGDELGRRAECELRGRGLRLELAVRDAPQRRAFTFVDGAGERTITIIGEKLVPRAEDPLAWSELERRDAVYFCGGDPEAVRLARRARILVATAREISTLAAAGVELDALVHSADDFSERYRPGDLDPPPKAIVSTEGPRGGRYTAAGAEGRWDAAPLPGPLADVYGAGDCFAAGLAYGLALGGGFGEATAFAARAAAEAMTVRGAFGADAGAASPRRVTPD